MCCATSGGGNTGCVAIPLKPRLKCRECWRKGRVEVRTMYEVSCWAGLPVKFSRPNDAVRYAIALHSIAQPSPSGKSSSRTPGKKRTTSFAVSRCRRYSTFGPYPGGQR